MDLPEECALNHHGATKAGLLQGLLELLEARIDPLTLKACCLSPRWIARFMLRLS